MISHEGLTSRCCFFGMDSERNAKANQTKKEEQTPYRQNWVSVSLSFLIDN
jgi:hypothetical protein